MNLAQTTTVYQDAKYLITYHFELTASTEEEAGEDRVYRQTDHYVELRTFYGNFPEFEQHVTNLTPEWLKVMTQLHTLVEIRSPGYTIELIFSPTRGFRGCAEEEKMVEHVLKKLHHDTTGAVCWKAGGEFISQKQFEHETEAARWG